MTDRAEASPSLSSASPERAEPSLPSYGLAIACVLHALPLGWAALVLPMHVGSWLALVLGVLTLLHVAVAVLALLRRARPLLIAWRTLAFASLAALLAASWVAGSSALYLNVLYRGIGRAVGAAMFGVWTALALFTVPIAAWGLAYTLRRGAPQKRAAGAALLIVVGALGSASLVTRGARAAPVDQADPKALVAALSANAKPRADVPQGSLFHLAPASCARPAADGVPTLLATALDRAGKPFAACVQADDAAGLARALLQTLDAQGVGETASALELVRAIDPWEPMHPLLDALSLRPALDGVCAGERCLAPWQLVAMSAFTQNRPLEAVPDASFGVSRAALTQALGVAAETPLVRIETASYRFERGQAAALVRQRPREMDAGTVARQRAAKQAVTHIVNAQQEDGSFRYLLDPFTGRIELNPDSLPRQAGTTLVLCELGNSEESAAAAERALRKLASYERVRPPLSAISERPDRGSVGASALPLVAFASCREIVGERHDALIGGLARTLIAMQREDGSFYPELDLATGVAQGEHEGLYSAGQAVLALVLVEQLAARSASPLWPTRAELAGAIDRAMEHYATRYWPAPLRSLFYLEENWHCLAARAALTSHRNDAYERFCLDYVAFKGRLILTPEEGTSPEQVGGYGLSDMFPPHNTASAGYGEALAAALAVKHARGEAIAEDQRTLARVLSFLVRQQWSVPACFVCGTQAAVGGFSESSGSPIIRIDYVQHALAALGHGSRALALRASGS